MRGLVAGALLLLAAPASVTAERPHWVVRVDLTDPATVVDLALANEAPRANSAQESFGDEAFPALVGRARAAVVINGTFFSKDAQKRVMGNMVRRGTRVKYSRWETAGTTFGLGPGNRPELVTAAVDGVPDPSRWWTAITAGPRLLRAGRVAIDPRREGFKDPHVLGAAGRSALGFTRDGRTLLLVSVGAGVTLAEEAALMRGLGAWEAMNLDGGASRALARDGRVLVEPGRPLTNVIAVYDAKHPAPVAVRRSLLAFGRTAASPTPEETPRAVDVLKGFGSWLLRKEK